MTRVLFATRAWESPEVEGGYLLLKDIARHLTAHDVEQFEACFFSSRDGEDEGITLFHAFRKPGWGVGRRLEFFRALLRFLSQVDVVHFAHTPTLLNSLFIRGLMRIFPTVTFVQTITGFSRQNRGSRSLYWGDVITTISPRVHTFLLDHHSISAEVITPHPQFERLATTAPLPGQLEAGFSDSPVVVLPIDMFRLDTRLFDIALICRELVQRHPAIRLVFLDRFGDETRIRALLAELPGDQVFFLPIVDYMAALIERASVVALPMTNVDGKFNPPMVLLEALHYGRPVVCSDNIDLPVRDLVSAVVGWNSDEWVRAISAAIESRPGTNEQAARTEFDRNCYRYLNIYQAGSTPVRAISDEPLSLTAFIDRLGAWARKNELPIFHRQDGFIDVDFKGCRDVDIWVRSTDSGALAAFLDAMPATRIIHRRAAYWSDQDIYVVRLAEGTMQLDVGVGRISTAYLKYASLDDFEAEPGLNELPWDVEIFSRGVKRQRRGDRLEAQDIQQFARGFEGLDKAAIQRLSRFFECDKARIFGLLAGKISPHDIRRLFASAIRRNIAIALAHPIEFIRVGASKLSFPLWPKPFGRRVKGQIIAIIGTDGSGKSTTLEALQSSLSRDGYRARTVYMGRARGNIVVSDKLKEKAESAYRKSSANWLKYVASWVYLFDYLARFARIYYLSRVRGESVLCDRYYFDIRLMERYSESAYKLLQLLAPKPDILAVLDCSVATLMSRKAERTPEEYEKQRRFYLDIGSSAKVRYWRGILDSDSLDSAAIEGILSSRIYRASHRGYDY